MRFWKKKDKGPYPRSFAKRLTWRIMIMLFIVMGIVSAILIFIGWLMTVGGGTILLNFVLDERSNRIEQTLTEVYVSTVNTVPDIEDNLHRPDHLQGIMKRIVELNPHIRSCGISFREGYYPQKGRWFCPYAQRSDSDSIVIMQTLGGKGQDYLHDEWFLEGMKAKEGYWSKPFFDDTNPEEPLVAYLVPIHDKRDSTVAVLGVDLSLEALAKQVSIKYNYDTNNQEQWSAEKEAYFFIVDSTGAYFMHPDAKRIGRQNFLDIVKKSADTTDDYVAEMILRDGESGYILGNEQRDEVFIDGEKVMICYTPVEHTPWKMVLVLPYFYVEIAFYGVGGLFLFFIIIGLVVVFFAGRRGIKKTSEPLRQLAASADEVAKGNFDTHLPDIKSRDEVHLLRDSFDNMQRSLTQYIEELKDTTAQKASMESELKIAHDIQMSMLPKIFPPYPERTDVDIYGTLTPAKGVGGDLFDFYIRDEKLFFCIGDVSGKGIPAALVMAVTRSLFRNISSYVSEPSAIVTALNNALADGNEANMFVTIFIGALNLQTGQLKYCNAGHDAPLLVGRDVGTLPCASNLPAGVIPNFKYEQQEAHIDPNTTIFLFTDGLNEAENANHAQYGDLRIHSVAKRVLAADEHEPLNLIYEMSEAVRDFVGDAEQSDDLTMLAIQYKG